MTTPDLTLSELRSLLHYDPETGVFTWLPRARERFSSDRLWKAWNTRMAGKRAGGPDPEGYIILGLLGRNYRAHRLAWFYVRGCWPEEVDHLNGVRDDNRWCNLREADRSLNMQNQRRALKNNSAGLLGVCWHKSRKTYQAYIRAKTQQIYLGSFDSAEAAHAAYLVAKREHHEGYIPQ